MSRILITPKSEDLLIDPDTPDKIIVVKDNHPDWTFIYDSESGDIDLITAKNIYPNITKIPKQIIDAINGLSFTDLS